MQLEYSISQDVYAFTALRDEQLPVDVTVGHQVHGNAVAVVDRPGMKKEELEGYDALVTNQKGLAIGVRTADCIPILLFDRKKKVVAAVHSGWKGTLQRICKSTLFLMNNRFRSEAKDIIAVIGPGISGKYFQVGEEVVNAFKEMDFPLNMIYSWTAPQKNGDMLTGHHLDLVVANRWLLEQEGVKPENIIVSGICTYENTGFFSARREGSDCGRNISAIMLR